MTLDLQIYSGKKHIAKPWVKALVKLVLQELNLVQSEISIVIVDDNTIHKQNKLWRHKNKATDVLSFPQYPPDQFDRKALHHGLTNPSLGDIMISYETATKQAYVYGWSLRFEMARLLVHGILHLLGHDHIHGGRQAGFMKKEELRLFRKIKHLL